jgi:hypothetical protein
MITRNMFLRKWKPRLKFFTFKKYDESFEKELDDLLKWHEHEVIKTLNNDLRKIFFKKFDKK